MDGILEFLFRFVLVPLAKLFFEVLADRPWLLLIVVLLIGGAVWKWGLPWIKGFYKLFGWQGILLAAAGLVSIGIFGAGWRAHRATVLTGVDREDPLFDLSPRKKPRPTKKPSKRPTKPPSTPTSLSEPSS